MNMLLKLIRPSRPSIAAAFLHANQMCSKNSKDFGEVRLVLEPLSHRQIIRVHGKDVLQFLQGLITNDMNHLETGQTRSMYAMFLNTSGRVLYDTIIYKSNEPDSYLIECDKDLSFELRRHLRQYRVRRKIDIDEANQQYQPWVLFNENLNDDTQIPIPKPVFEEFLHAPDPRVRSLGVRLLASPEKQKSDFAKAFAFPSNSDIELCPPKEKSNYNLRRYMQGVGEGPKDLPPGKCFPLEANCDFLHGVSFHKGCYIGQELTARIHHTGVIRKRLMPMRLTVPINEDLTTIQSPAGAKVGNIRGIHSDRALALLRVDQALNSEHLMIDGDPCYVDKPNWWPKELPKKPKLPND